MLTDRQRSVLVRTFRTKPAVSAYMQLRRVVQRSDSREEAAGAVGIVCSLLASSVFVLPSYGPCCKLARPSYCKPRQSHYAAEKSIVFLNLSMLSKYVHN